MMKKAEKKRVTFKANLGDLNRPLRVRPVNVEGRNWWAVDAEDTWPGMVMDLRRLGFESMAHGEEVLVREGSPACEPQMEGPAAQGWPGDEGGAGWKGLSHRFNLGDRGVNRPAK